MENNDLIRRQDALVAIADMTLDGNSQYIWSSDVMDAIKAINPSDGKVYTAHDVACILADAFGDNCACNFNDIDEWLPWHCEFTLNECPNPVGVACWEQFLKHLDKRGEKH